METIKKAPSLSVNDKLSTLWIVVMMNMIFADICSFMIPDSLSNIIEGNLPIVITQELMLVFALLLEIPMVMIFLSRVLKPKANRWTNIVACVITIPYVIGGGSAYLHYYFFAAVEIACMLAILWISWKRKSTETAVNS